MSDLKLAADIVALIPAAGGGLRLGQGPKAFLQLADRSLLQHVVDFVATRVERILVAVPESHLEIARAQLGNRAEVYIGGTTRLGTIAGLLEKCTESLIIIHDAARPFTSTEVLDQVIEAGSATGAAVCYRKLKVPAARIVEGWIKESIPPSEGGSFETPQAFRRSILEQVFQYAHEQGIADEALSDLVVRTGIPFRAVPDTEWNYKITTPLDWEIATKVIAPMRWPGPTGRAS